MTALVEEYQVATTPGSVGAVVPAGISAFARERVPAKGDPKTATPAKS
jgi:hypothetical protein